MLPNDAVDLLSTLTPGQPMNIMKEILNCIFSTSRPPGGVSCTWTSRCVRHGEFGNNTGHTDGLFSHSADSRNGAKTQKGDRSPSKCQILGRHINHPTSKPSSSEKGKLQRPMCENSHTICSYSQRNGIIEQSIPCGCNCVT